MSNTKRALKVLKGLLALLCSLILLVNPEEGYYLVVFILDASLLLYALRLIFYYFTMARYTVGGIITLYKSILVFDFGLFVFSLRTTPQKFVMIYLIIGIAFSGVIDILESLEAKKLQSGSWKYRCFYGTVKLLVAVVCVMCLDSAMLVTMVYAFGLAHSAVSEIIGAFRKTAIVYIE